MDKNIVFFGESGLTSTSANHYEDAETQSEIINEK